RTPNSFRGHVLLAAALRHGIEMQNQVAERLFTGYFTEGLDVGDVNVLRSIAREAGVDVDLEDPELAAYVRSEEQAVRDSGVQGVPLIRYNGVIVSEGAGPSEMIAARLI